MIKHIILWQLKDELSDNEKKEIKINIKNGLENLLGKIPGILEIKVLIDPLETSNVDIMLDSSFEDDNALAVYTNDSKHIRVKDELIVPYVKSRYCMDFKA